MILTSVDKYFLFTFQQNKNIKISLLVIDLEFIQSLGDSRNDAARCLYTNENVYSIHLFDSGNGIFNE